MHIALSTVWQSGNSQMGKYILTIFYPNKYTSLATVKNILLFLFRVILEKDCAQNDTALSTTESFLVFIFTFTIIMISERINLMFGQCISIISSSTSSAPVWAWKKPNNSYRHSHDSYINAFSINFMIIGKGFVFIFIYNFVIIMIISRINLRFGQCVTSQWRLLFSWFLSSNTESLKRFSFSPSSWSAG